MSESKVQAARELINERNYDLARALLRTIPGDATAVTLLERIDALAPARPATAQPRKGNKGGILIGVLVILLISVGVGYFVWNGNNQRTEQLARAEFYSYCVAYEQPIECARGNFDRYKVVYLYCYDLVKDRPLNYWRTCLREQGVIP